MKERHMERGKCLLLLCALLCIPIFAGCGANKQTDTQVTLVPAEEESVLLYPVTITLGYSTGDQDPRGLSAQLFKEKVEEETDGNILIEIHPSGELGSDSQLIRQVMDSQVDMTVSSAGNFAAYATRVGVSALPYLFTDFESAWKFMDSDIMKSLNADLEDYNIHVLSYFDNGFRCITTSEAAGPIEQIQDLAGLYIRTPDNQVVMETLSSLGANPKSLPFTELKDALSKGQFDGQENPIPVIYNSGIFQVQKYLAVTNHSYDAMPFVIRSDLWNNLSPDYQQILEEAAQEASAYDRNLVQTQTKEDLDKLQQEGMIVTYPDLAEFKKYTSQVKYVFSTVYGEDLLRELDEFSVK